jgi:hypothetical protein
LSVLRDEMSSMTDYQPMRMSIRQTSQVSLGKTKLEMARCPHCNVAKPNLDFEGYFQGGNPRLQFNNWAVYQCGSCHAMVMAQGSEFGLPVHEIFPRHAEVSHIIPELPRTYLQEAKDTIASPAACVLVANSAVNAMLKDKGIDEKVLYTGIDRALEKGLITADMASWAHEVRMDANNPRHVDRDNPLPTLEDAARIVELVEAFAHYLYVLPAMVSRGREAVARGIAKTGKIEDESN